MEKLKNLNSGKICD
jgi:hypothetical protein